MSHRTPSKIRREGREAYELGQKIEDNPYSYKVWCSDATNWEDGWFEAKKMDSEIRKQIMKDITICPTCGQSVPDKENK